MWSRVFSQSWQPKINKFLIRFQCNARKAVSSSSHCFGFILFLNCVPENLEKLTLVFIEKSYFSFTYKMLGWLFLSRVYQTKDFKADTRCCRLLSMVLSNERKPCVIVKTDPSEQNQYSDTELPKDLGLKNVKNPT